MVVAMAGAAAIIRESLSLSRRKLSGVARERNRRSAKMAGFVGALARAILAAQRQTRALSSSSTP